MPPVHLLLYSLSIRQAAVNQLFWRIDFKRGHLIYVQEFLFASNSNDHHPLVIKTLSRMTKIKRFFDTFFIISSKKEVANNRMPKRPTLVRNNNPISNLSNSITSYIYWVLWEEQFWLSLNIVVTDQPEITKTWFVLENRKWILTSS